MTAALPDPPERRRPTCPPSPRSTPGTCCTAPAPSRLDPPDAAEMARRRDDVLAKGLPWLVAERERRGARLRLRQPLPAAPGLPLLPRGLDLPRARRRSGQGLGRLLLAELLARCEARGRAPDAGGDRRLGQPRLDRRAPRARLRAGRARMHAAGWKFERWLDVVLMQKRLGLGRRRARRGTAPMTASADLHVEDARHLARRARRQPRRCTASTCTAGATRWGWLHPAADAARRCTACWRVRALGQDDQLVAGC